MPLPGIHLVRCEEPKRCRTRPEGDQGIFPDMGHDMMLEDGWQAVADRILSWLHEKGL